MLDNKRRDVTALRVTTDAVTYLISYLPLDYYEQKFLTVSTIVKDIRFLLLDKRLLLIVDISKTTANIVIFFNILIMITVCTNTKNNKVLSNIILYYNRKQLSFLVLRIPF